MYVIVLASQKGGAGKTTLAAHLAVATEAAGDGPAVLIDTDPQGSLSAWWNVRATATPQLAPTAIAELPEKLQLLAGAGYRVAVIDTPPAITEAIGAVVQSADLVLFRPAQVRMICAPSAARCRWFRGRESLRIRHDTGQAEYSAYRAGHGGAVRARQSGSGDRA